ncbi:CHAT domain-containing protein [Rhizobium leguminosarum bv. viciae]|nr:CHAT domain-containing protein [Rhizobium leguminosarum bv. viciae]
MSAAHTFYARAASRGLQRSVVGAHRTDERLRMAWIGEIKALCQYTATIDVSPEQGNGKAMVVYARNLPVPSPLFVSEKWQQVEIKDNGIQVFGARLNIGDRVRFRNGETLKFEGSNETAPFGRVVIDGQPEVVLLPGDDPFSATEWPTRTPEPTASGVTFTALSGRDDAVTLADPDWRVFRLGTAEYLGGFFTNDIELFEPKTVAVPEAARVIGLIKGGTDFEIRRDGNLLLRMLVPVNLNLYLDFHPDDLSSIFVDTTDAGLEHPNEIYAGRVAPPNAVLYANGLPFGRYYSRYDTQQDGVFAMPEFNAPILAMGAFYRGDSDKELRLLLLSARSKTMHTGGVSLEAIQARAELARPLANMGQLREAIELRSAAVRELQEFEIQPNRPLIEQLNQLAALHQQDNDLSRAIIVARQALALAQGLADPSRKGKPFPDHSYVRSVGLLAELYRQAGETDRAYLYYQRLIGLDLLGDPEIRTNGNMAAYVALADLALAKGERAVSSAAARFTLPFAKADAGQRDKPDPLQRPITVPDAITRMFGPKESSSIIAEAFLRLGDAYWYASYPWKFSEPVYEVATIGALGSAGPGSALALRSSARLAMVRWMIGKNDGNLDLLKKAGRLGGDQSVEAADSLASAEMPLFNSAFVGTLDWYQDNHFIDDVQKFSEAASLFEANERGDSFALSFQLAELHRRAETADQKLALQSWTEATAALSKLTRQLNSLVEGRGVSASPQLSKTRRELEGLRKAELDAVGIVARTFGLPNLRTPNVNLVSKLQPLLRDDEVVLDLLPSRYSVAALVITKTTRRIVTYPMTDVDIAGRLKAMRAALDPDILEVKGYNKIDLPPLLAVRPFTTDLMGPDAGTKRSWIIIAHGPLRSLPFEAIPLSADVSDDPDNVFSEASKWAGLSKQISYLPSLDSLLTLRSGISPSKATQPISVVADPIMPGDPRYAGGFARRLDNVQQNIRYARWSIGTWLGKLQPVPETSGLGFRALLLLDGDIQNLFSGRRATRDAILNSRKLEDSKVILFATHGETAESHPEFGEPFLALTPPDGSSESVDPLTASEISTLGLDADLVFLSACDTAAPDGTPGQSGFSGLAQAFVSAGARTLVATQWKITTRAADLATGATLRAAKNRSRAASAVMQGRMAVAESFGHPSFWSAFAMVGDPEYDWRLSN